MTLSLPDQVGDSLAGDVSGDVAHQAGDGCSLCIAVFMHRVQTRPLHTLTENGQGSHIE